MQIRTRSLEDEDHNDAKEMTYGVLIFLSVLVIGILAYRQSKDRETWTEIRGQVVSVVEQDGWRLPRGLSQARKKETEVVTRYQYSVAGKTYNGRRFEHCTPSARWQEGARRELVEKGKTYPIAVYYNPKDVRESILVKPDLGWSDYIKWGLILFAAAFTVWATWKKVRDRYN